MPNSKSRLILTCPHCGTRNCITKFSIGRGTYRCGSCKTVLPDPYFGSSSDTDLKTELTIVHLVFAIAIVVSAGSILLSIDVEDSTVPFWGWVYCGCLLLAGPFILIWQVKLVFLLTKVNHFIIEERLIRGSQCLGFSIVVIGAITLLIFHRYPSFIVWPIRVLVILIEACVWAFGGALIFLFPIYWLSTKSKFLRNQAIFIFFSVTGCIVSLWVLYWVFAGYLGGIIDFQEWIKGERALWVLYEKILPIFTGIMLVPTIIGLLSWQKGIKVYQKIEKWLVSSASRYSEISELTLFRRFCLSNIGKLLRLLLIGMAISLWFLALLHFLGNLLDIDYFNILAITIVNHFLGIFEVYNGWINILINLNKPLWIFSQRSGAAVKIISSAILMFTYVVPASFPGLIFYSLFKVLGVPSRGEVYTPDEGSLGNYLNKWTKPTDSTPWWDHGSITPVLLAVQATRYLMGVMTYVCTKIFASSVLAVFITIGYILRTFSFRYILTLGAAILSTFQVIYHIIKWMRSGC